MAKVAPTADWLAPGDETSAHVRFPPIADIQPERLSSTHRGRTKSLVAKEVRATGVVRALTLRARAIGGLDAAGAARPSTSKKSPAK